MLILCLLSGLILSVYCGKGRLHDFALWKKAKARLNPATVIYADSGFLGLAKRYPKAVLPYKASKLHPLTKVEKQQNRQLARQRIAIQHVNRACKIFRILKDTYRGKHKNYGLHWNVIAAIYNLKKACHHFNIATP